MSAASCLVLAAVARCTSVSETVSLVVWVAPGGRTGDRVLGPAHYTRHSARRWIFKCREHILNWVSNRIGRISTIKQSHGLCSLRIYYE